MEKRGESWRAKGVGERERHLIGGRAAEVLLAYGTNLRLWIEHEGTCCNASEHGFLHEAHDSGEADIQV